MLISLMCCSSHVEVKTPQERSLNVTDDTRDVPPTTDDNEKLVVVQEEMHPHNKSLSKTMDMT